MLHNPVSFNPVSPGQPMLEAAGDGQRTHRLPFSIESILSIGGPNANRQSCRAPSPDRMPRYRRSCQTSSPARMSRDRSHYQTPSPARMSREKPSCYTQSPARLSREKPDFYTQSPARMSRDRSHYQTPSPARMSREKPSCYTQSPARLSRRNLTSILNLQLGCPGDRSHYQTPSPARMSREKPDSNTQSPARMSKDGSRYQTPSPARMPRGRTSGQIQSPVKQSMRRPTWTHQPSPGMPMESSSCCLPPAHAPPYDYQHRLVHNYSPLFYYHQSVHPAMVHPQLTVRVPRGECPCKDPYCSEQVLPYPYCMATTDSSLNWRTRPSKSKRIRTVFTPEQLERLEAEFIKQQYMVGTERVDLAATLNLTETQIKVWFQNRRIKGRKQRVEQKKPKVS